jgi:hypothetical protein
MSSGKAGSAEYPAAGFFAGCIRYFSGCFLKKIAEGSGYTPAAVHIITVSLLYPAMRLLRWI